MLTIPTLSSVAEAAREAGAIMLSAGAAHPKAKSGEGNFVTEYDVAIQKRLRVSLGALCPCSFLGEEDDGSASDAAGLTWVVDPIDGTSNFMHGMLASCVSVALTDASENIPLLAAVYNPFSGELFTAERGRGAFLNGERLRVSSRGYGSALISFGTTPYNRAAADTTFELAKRAFMRSLDVRRSGSAALDLAFLAAGRTDGFFELRLQPWDYAAGRLLIEEAGGVVTTFDGEPLNLAAPSSVLAGSEEVYRELRRCAEGLII